MYVNDTTKIIKTKPLNCLHIAVKIVHNHFSITQIKGNLSNLQATSEVELKNNTF